MCSVLLCKTGILLHSLSLRSSLSLPLNDFGDSFAVYFAVLFESIQSTEFDGLVWFGFCIFAELYS